MEFRMTHSNAAYLDETERATDPVCGMEVKVGTATRSTAYNGQTYYFCSQRCLDKFSQEPHKFSVTDQASIRKSEPTERPSLPAAAEYTCPMHPEVVRNAPGTCPICGMALETRTPTADVENPELRDMTRRFWIGGELCVP